MSFEWLRMRIQEEQERRKRESSTLDRLPLALDELHGVLRECVSAYVETFGEESAEIRHSRGRIKVSVREPKDGVMQTTSKVEVVAVPEIPGFRVERAEYSLAVEVGILPNEKLFYRDCEQDKYLTLEDLTRRILDRTFFPKLKE